MVTWSPSHCRTRLRTWYSSLTHFANGFSGELMAVDNFGGYEERYESNCDQDRRNIDDG